MSRLFTKPSPGQLAASDHERNQAMSEAVQEATMRLARPPLRQLVQLVRPLFITGLLGNSSEMLQITNRPTASANSVAAKPPRFKITDCKSNWQIPHLIQIRPTVPLVESRFIFPLARLLPAHRPVAQQDSELFYSTVSFP